MFHVEVAKRLEHKDCLLHIAFSFLLPSITHKQLGEILSLSRGW